MRTTQRTLPRVSTPSAVPKRAIQASPLRKPSRQLPFAAGALTGLLGVLLVGWFTPLREVMHALLVTLGAAATWPFAVVLGLVAVLATTVLATAIVADDVATGAATAPGRTAHGPLRDAYFAQVRRQRRHPFAWAAGAGASLGIVGIWMVLAALVVPLEIRTLSLLLFSQVRIDAAAAGAPITLAADGLLHPSAWRAPTGDGDAAVIDTFGHPIAHDAGAVPGAPYTLRSLGLDASPSGDDLCIRGPADPSRTPAALRDPLVFLERLRDDQLGWPERFDAVAQTRCNR